MRERTAHAPRPEPRAYQPPSLARAYQPRSLAEALRIRGREAVIPFAGGTDLMVQRRRPTGLTPRFELPALFIGGLEELRGISEGDGVLTMGACCTCSRVLEERAAPPALRRVVEEIGSPAVKNRATMGGNICNASPAGDTLPALYALESRVVLRSERGGRTLPIEEFILGPGKTALAEDELLVAVEIPTAWPGRLFYRKIGTRRANALSKLSFLGMASNRRGRLVEARMAFGAVAPTVVRSRRIESGLRDAAAAELAERTPEVLELYAALIKPIDDQRSTAHYRKEAALRLLRFFLQRLAADL